jgi:hypothetical protein
MITLDGGRVRFDEGWGLIRASNTQPAIVLRFEARDAERLQEIQRYVYGHVAAIYPVGVLPVFCWLTCLCLTSPFKVPQA